jgi:hypothetical protein
VLERHINVWSWFDIGHEFCSEERGFTNLKSKKENCLIGSLTFTTKFVAKKGDLPIQKEKRGTAL